jgi:hypothetical protein
MKDTPQREIVTSQSGGRVYGRKRVKNCQKSLGEIVREGGMSAKI